MTLTLQDSKRLRTLFKGPHGDSVLAFKHVDVLIVFCSSDPQLAATLAQLYDLQVFTKAILTGGLGRHSGPLGPLGIAESQFIASLAIGLGIPGDNLLLETAATNGETNARFSIHRGISEGVIQDGTQLASLAPVFRSYRLFQELRFQAAQLDLHVDVVSGYSSGEFNPSNGDDLHSLSSEVRGLNNLWKAGRMFVVDSFQPGGQFYDLVEKVRQTTSQE